MDDEHADSATEVPGKKEPYEAPAIEETAEYETLALACGFATGKTCLYSGGYGTS